MALSLGIDLISTDYPHALSAKGHALALSPTLLSCIDDDAAPAQTNPDKRSISGHEGDTQKSNKRQRVETIFSDGSDQHAVEEVASERVSLRQGQSSHGGTPPTFRCELNLWDVKYCKDTRPLVCIVIYFCALLLTHVVKMIRSKVVLVMLVDIIPALIFITCIFARKCSLKS